MPESRMIWATGVVVFLFRLLGGKFVKGGGVAINGRMGELCCFVDNLVCMVSKLVSRG